MIGKETFAPFYSPQPLRALPNTKTNMNEMMSLWQWSMHSLIKILSSI